MSFIKYLKFSGLSETVKTEMREIYDETQKIRNSIPAFETEKPALGEIHAISTCPFGEAARKYPK